MKRIIGALLSILTVLSVIPAVSPVIYAEDKYEYTAPKSYTDYKKLYYDDGHLIAFIDLSHLDAEGAVATMDDYGKDKAKFDSAKVILGEDNNYTQKSKNHSFVRIIDGKAKGNYYILGAKSPDKIEIVGDQIEISGTYGNVWTRDAMGVPFRNAYSQSTIVNESLAYDSSDMAEYRVTFLSPTAEQNKDKYFGVFALDGVYKLGVGNIATEAVKETNPVYFNFMKISTLSLGSVKILPASAAMCRFAQGSNTDTGALGRGKTVDNIAFGNTVHLAFNYQFTDKNSLSDDAYLVLSSEVKLASDRSKVSYAYPTKNTDDACIETEGMYLYFARIYDCELTTEQIARNHFADLCYYYQLENADKLLILGSSVLNESLYAKFLGFQVGNSNSTQIQNMQTIINQAAARTPDIADLKTKAAGGFEKIENAYNNADSQIKAAETVISDIAEKLTEADLITPFNSEAQDIINENKASLLSVKNTLTDYVDEMKAYFTDLKTRRDSAKTAADSVKTQSDVYVCCENVNTIEENINIVLDGADKIDNINVRCLANKETANKIIEYMNTANANAAFNISDYVKFAGFQIRYLDYAAMRAVFTADTAKTASGYTYGDEEYEIIDAGMVCGTGNIKDIKVSWKDGRAVAEGDGSFVESFEDRYEISDFVADAARKETGISGGKVYAIVKSYRLDAYSNLKASYQKEYAFRAYVVVSNGKTEFIKYLDAESAKLGSSVSLYEIADYVKDKVSADKLNSAYYIQSVLDTVNG